MDVRNCKVCGRIFNYLSGPPVCQVCKENADMKFQEVKEYVRDNTTSGCLDINDTLVHFSSPYLPFGGVGNSGMSSYHGNWGFDNMSHLKPIVDQSSLLLSFRYPPYSKSALKLLKFVIPFKYNRNQLIKFFMYLILLILFPIFILPRFIYKN